MLRRIIGKVYSILEKPKRNRIEAALSERYNTRFSKFDPENQDSMKRFRKPNIFTAFIAHRLFKARSEEMDKEFERKMIHMRDTGEWAEKSKQLVESRFEKLKEIASQSYSLEDFVRNYKKYKAETREKREKMKGTIRYYADLYNRSIENIVEGQREVTSDPGFREEEDGLTVKEKMDEFERKLRVIISNFRVK